MLDWTASAHGGVSAAGRQQFKSWDVDQVVWQRPSVQELVPAGHLAHVVRDMVRESRDGSAILKPSTEACGFPPSEPTLMPALLLYAYKTRVLRRRDGSRRRVKSEWRAWP